MIRLNIPQSSRPRKRKPSSKRFYLVHLWGGVEVNIVSKGFRVYDEVLAAARNLVNTPEYNEGKDNVFYLVTCANKPPQMGDFTSDELDPGEPTLPKKNCGAWDDDEGH